MSDYDPTDEPQPPDVLADGITFTLTPAQLVVGADRNGPVRLVDLVVERAAQLLVAQADQSTYRKMRDEVYGEMKASIRSELDGLVAGAMAGAIQPTNRWGGGLGPAHDPARGDRQRGSRLAQRGPVADRHPPRPTLPLPPIEKAVKGDLADVMAKARETVKAKIQLVATEQLSSVLVKALG